MTSALECHGRAELEPSVTDTTDTQNISGGLVVLKVASYDPIESCFCVRMGHLSLVECTRGNAQLSLGKSGRLPVRGGSALSAEGRVGHSLRSKCRAQGVRSISGRLKPGTLHRGWETEGAPLGQGHPPTSPLSRAAGVEGISAPRHQLGTTAPSYIPLLLPGCLGTPCTVVGIFLL